MPQTRMLMPTCRHANTRTCRRANAPTRQHVNTPTRNASTMHRRADTPTRHQRANAPSHQHAIMPTRRRPLTHACPRVHPTPNSQLRPRADAPVHPMHPRRYMHHLVVLTCPRHQHADILMCSEYPHRHDLLYIRSSPFFVQ